MIQKASAAGQIWAVSLLTLREAFRRRVFYILFVFLLILISSAFFFPAVDVEARVQLIQLWSLRATILFCAIISIFVVGFSLPGDMEHRRVYILLTKPVSKAVFFLGRLCGFAIVLAVFLVIMSFISVLYIRVSQALGGPDFPELPWH